MQDHFAEALTAEFGQDVLFGHDIPRRFYNDWAGLPPVAPRALVRPRTTKQVSAVMRICSEFRVPVTPQGGLTGLNGGARPIEGGVALSLDRMNEIEEIDTVMATMTLQAGVVLGVAQRAAEDAGLFLGLDLGARDSCMIGGNLSTNAGGNRVIRFGMAREHVLGIEVVLPNGTIVTSLNKMLKNNAGYDLKQLFIGSEGTLGIITRAVLRLQAKPAELASAFCGCPDFASLLSLLKSARQRMGSALTSFEVMWPSFYDFMTSGLPHLRRALNDRHGIYVLIETAGRDAAENRLLLEQVLSEALESGAVTDAVLPSSERETRDLWAVRDSVSEYGKLMGPLTAFDVGLPTSKAGKAVEQIEAAIRARWPDGIALCYGHIGDSNLHIVCNIPSAGDEQPHEAITKLVFGFVAEHGGTISAEHGIGLLKKPYLKLSRSPEELELMARIKRALDPDNILNTGKVLSI
ncbi:FAD-binding oxidoreductase (plasmid) [Neorhizobium sp. SOG26]|jgi:FAD/FMN-containing dehydrogenases|uniref:FAD-binding oxidoreductase n=1 Tax=Neorhizobium sp. SOG26 TaxID=2060726 RepID=UPI000E588523|nr:FAD-binding oxidoreductase [Neorhizobium sp. SOG26]AXV18478.1 FAD-binding oxidoreductase [Neorhizobium sp. SOG26]